MPFRPSGNLLKLFFLFFLLVALAGASPSPSYPLVHARSLNDKGPETDTNTNINTNITNTNTNGNSNSITNQPCPLAHRPASDIINRLHLTPNIERGYYAQTFQDPNTTCAGSNRSLSTLIYYLLEAADSPSKWHRLDATEVWHFYAGAPLTLSLSRDDGQPETRYHLGMDLFAGQEPQVVVPRGVWQRASSWGEWTLVGTTVSPGFTSTGFELAPPGWNPKEPI
ncbi:hypothetical protein E4U55_002928 [Claviceps digitariae]|nr:hypothetical protein E4U55_002928 [Claviceps digitariae]